jgi:apolipoprotein N-acyltransferase
MDVTSWGEHEHWLHAKVAPTRAAEYGIPVVRVCSSGISQIVTADGHVAESLPYPGQGESFAARVQLVDQVRVPMDRTLALVGLIATMMFVGVITGKRVLR